jgi:hypothetical protein
MTLTVYGRRVPRAQVHQQPGRRAGPARQAAVAHRAPDHGRGPRLAAQRAHPSGVWHGGLVERRLGRRSPPCSRRAAVRRARRRPRARAVASAGVRGLRQRAQRLHESPDLFDALPRRAAPRAAAHESRNESRHCAAAVVEPNRFFPRHDGPGAMSGTDRRRRVRNLGAAGVSCLRTRWSSRYADSARIAV